MSLVLLDSLIEAARAGTTPWMRCEGATMVNLGTGLLDNVVVGGWHADRTTLRVGEPRLDVVVGVHRRRVRWRMRRGVHVSLAVAVADSGVLVCLNLVSSWTAVFWSDKDTHVVAARDRRAESSLATLMSNTLLRVADKTDVVRGVAGESLEEIRSRSKLVKSVLLTDLYRSNSP